MEKMSNIHEKQDSSTNEIHEGKVFYEGKYRTIQERRGWKHVEIRSGNTRRLIPLAEIEGTKCNGDSEPVYFGNMLYGYKSNWWQDHVADCTTRGLPVQNRLITQRNPL